MPIQDITTLKGYFNNGDVPTESEYIDLIDSMFGMQSTISEGPGIDVTVDSVIGLGLDSILIARQDGTPATEYATITLACASASSGDIILIARAGTFAESFTVPAGVALVGLGREKCIITGMVTLSSGSSVEKLSIIRAANDGNNLICVTGPLSGIAYISNCSIMAMQLGSGIAAAIFKDSGSIVTRFSIVHNYYNGAPAWPFISSAIGPYDITIETSADDLAYHLGIYSVVPPTGWELNSYDDSEWEAAVVVFDPGVGFPDKIWYTSNYSYNGGPHRAIFRRHIIIPAGIVTLASITKLNFDDIGHGFFNGTEVVPDTGTNYGEQPVPVDILENVLPGQDNILAFNVCDALQGSGGFQYYVRFVGIGIGNIALPGYAVVLDTGFEAAITTESGDLATRNAEDYPTSHTNDIDTATGIHHTLGTGATNAAAGSHTHTPDSEAANTVYAGPISGADAIPTFRVLTADDIPEYTFDPESANTVFAGPISGIDATPIFRALTLADIPIANTHYEILQDSNGAFLTDENGEILYVEVNN